MAHKFHHWISELGYGNRSEAVRDVLRKHLARAQEQRDAEGPCVANLSYVYNHHEHELSDRLARLQHDYRDLTLATTHAHLDHDQFIETMMLKGHRVPLCRHANGSVRRAPRAAEQEGDYTPAIEPSMLFRHCRVAKYCSCNPCGTDSR